MKLKVKCTVYVEVELPDDADASFMIEDNGCPGTGVVGAEIMRLIEHHEESRTCWACAAQGKNEIVERY